MAEIFVSFSKGSKQLKELRTSAAGDNLSDFINALKEAKDTTNSFLTELVNEQKETSNSCTRKAEELAYSDEDSDEVVKKQKR